MRARSRAARRPARGMPGADAGHMARAVELARRGYGATSPNPMVGAVVVRGGRVVGTGHHRRAGADHAEVIALRRAGARARGATLYVNLEPCAHHGRTPPCVDAILAAGIRRVVASIVDPDRRVRGRGFTSLRRAGVDVVTGVGAAEAVALNEAYLRFARTGRPFVHLKAGMSLDGRIASATGASRWITSPRSRREGQRLRWGADAILVGVGTVLADDPLLSARRAGREKRRFVRVILDSELRTPPAARVVRTAERLTTRIYTLPDAPAARERRLRAAGVEVVRLPGAGGRVSARRVLGHLGHGGCTSVLLEGGGEVNASFLSAGLVDRLTLFIAPKLLGGRDAVPVVGGRGCARPADALRLDDWTIRPLDGDLVLEGRPRRRRGV